MISFQLLLILDWSYQIEIIYQQIASDGNKSLSEEAKAQKSISYLFILQQLFCRRLIDFKLSLKYLINLLWRDSFFILLLISNLIQMYDIYSSYSLITILICPLKTYNLIFVIFIRFFKFKNFKLKDFNLNVSNRQIDHEIESVKSRLNDSDD